jgi:hypothetical protein
MHACCVNPHREQMTKCIIEIIYRLARAARLLGVSIVVVDGDLLMCGVVASVHLLSRRGGWYLINWLDSKRRKSMKRTMLITAQILSCLA